MQALNISSTSMLNYLLPKCLSDGNANTEFWIKQLQGTAEERNFVGIFVCKKSKMFGDKFKIIVFQRTDAHFK